jgi:hypothetical protein
VGGYNYNNDYPAYTGSLADIKYHQLETNNFTAYTNTYFVTPRYEETNNPVEPSELDTAELKMYCEKCNKRACSILDLNCDKCGNKIRFFMSRYAYVDRKGNPVAYCTKCNKRHEELQLKKQESKRKNIRLKNRYLLT